MGGVASDVGRISKPGSRFTASRRLSTGNRKAIAQHNYRVGEVLHAFNTAQASFFLVFWRLAADTDIDLATELWDTGSTDLAQRKMLAVFARRKVQRASIKRGLLWAIAAMDKLAERRNDAVHADVIWYYDKIIPGLATKRARQERLEQNPFDTIWHDLRGDLSAIANYVFDLHLDLSADHPWPMTKRPKLKLVPRSVAKSKARGVTARRHKG